MTKCIYAIGDIHGRLDCLLDMQALIKADASKYDEKTVVYLGDFIDRGPNSRGVIEHRLYNPMEGFTEIDIRGNHELFMLGTIKGVFRPSMMASWLMHGGQAVVKNYGLDLNDYGTPHELGKAYSLMPNTFAWDEIMHDLVSAVPEEHLAFLERTKLFHFEDGHLFVHAGINPNVPLSEQAEDDLLWIREEFLNSPKDYGMVVVHGHTPAENVEFRHNRIGCDTRAYATGILSCAVIADDGYRVLQTDCGTL